MNSSDSKKENDDDDDDDGERSKRSSVRFIIAMGLFAILFVMFGFVLFAEENPHSEAAGLRVNKGFWGETTANIDWCERNYAVTFYIAEFWNTLSSLMMVFVGFVGLYAMKKTPVAFRIGYLALVCVGLGSTCFHATMRREEQMLDEVPMLFAVSAIFYISLTARAVKKMMPMSARRNSLRKTVLLGLFVTFCFTITTLMFVYPDNPVIFLSSFGISLTLTVVSGVMRYYYGGRSGRPVPKAQLYAEIALTIWAVGGIAWCIEPHICHEVGPIQLHAWWHMAAGVATHMTLQFHWYLEIDFLVSKSDDLTVESQSTCCLPFGVIVVSSSSETSPSAIITTSNFRNKRT